MNFKAPEAAKAAVDALHRTLPARGLGLLEFRVQGLGCRV